MNLSGFALKVGQRFQLSFSDRPQFIGEVTKLHGGSRARLKVVHLQGWSQCRIGYEYGDEDLSRTDYTYLPGQDRPTV